MNLAVVPPIDVRAVLLAAMDAAAMDPAWHPLRYATREDAEEPDREAHPGIHPSDLAIGCNRSLVYATVNAPRDAWRHASTSDRRAQDSRTFDHGKMLHVLVQAYLQLAVDAGLLDVADVEVPTGPRHNIVGTMDALILKGGARMGIEIKSAGPSTYYGTKDMTRAVTALTQPVTAHRRQAAAYMRASGLEWFAFVYWDKAMDDFAVLPWRADAETAEAVRREAEFGLEAAERRILPARVTDVWKCGRCPFRSICSQDLPFETFDRRHRAA
mgnify:CR=1 FL=1